MDCCYFADSNMKKSKFTQIFSTWAFKIILKNTFKSWFETTKQRKPWFDIEKWIQYIFRNKIYFCEFHSSFIFKQRERERKRERERVIVADNNEPAVDPYINYKQVPHLICNSGHKPILSSGKPKSTSKHNIKMFVSTAMEFPNAKFRI